MPEFKTTAKDVAAPFVKRTSDVVTLATGETNVYFTRGENEKGWIAFAGASLDAIHAKGSTLDGAVNALIFHTEDGVKAGSFPAGETVPEPDADTAEPVKGESVDIPDVSGDDVAAGESKGGENSAPVTAPVKLTGGKLSALVMSAYRESAAAVSQATARKITVESAEKITCRVYADIFDLIGDGRKAGIDTDKLDRMSTYALGLIAHHNSIMGGGIGTRMTSGQNKRARAKLAAVAASLV